MKLIHLSDLHLGKRVNEISMLEEQEYILLEILQVIDEEKPSAVLIAGDIYDKSVPSAEAVQLLDDFLCRLSKRKLPVFLISGNHDSPERLAFGNRLFENSGVYISSAYHGTVEAVTLHDQWGEVKIWLLPFVKPAVVKHYYPDESIESYTDACRVALQQVSVDTTKRNVLLAHQFVVGAETCESEEIHVGGLDQVSADVFDSFDYVALGHIHGPQNITSKRIRYCGTPLKYSFSEENHNKSITIVNLGAKGELDLELRPLTPRHDLRSIRGKFAELMDSAATLGTERNDYLQVILTDEDDIPEAVGRLRTLYPNLMKLTYDNARTRGNQVIEAVSEIQQKTPFQLFADFYQQQNNQTMREEQREFMEKLLASLEEENA